MPKAKVYQFPQVKQVNKISFKSQVHNCVGRAAELMYNKTITLDEYREFFRWIDKQKEGKVKAPTSEVVSKILDLVGGI